MYPSKKCNLADDNPSSEISELNKTKKDQQKPPLNDQLGSLDNLYFDFTSPPFKNVFKGADFQLVDQDYKKESPFASLRIVKDFASRSRKLKGENIHIPSKSQKLSTIERIRMAGLHFIDSSSKADETSNPSHPFPASISGLSNDEAKDIDHLLTLLASADKIGQRQFDEANELVELCSQTCSNEGTPIERLVYYFSEAIREKIDRETGREASGGLERMRMFDFQKAVMSVDASILAFHKKVPLSQVCQFSAINTLVEHVRRARHIHIIDLEIRSGMQYTLMMQVIASRSEWQLKHLKITAIGTRSESKIKETCNHLAEFAQSMNIPFTYKIVMVADMLDFNIDLLELDRHEKLAVYSSVSLSNLIVKPNRLEHLMLEIRKINPCITIVNEVEANHTSLVFVNRFIDALFFYGALFDSISICLADDDRNRKVAESVYYTYSIRNIVAAEGDDRTIRHTGINVWRTFFGRFGMVEIELSSESLNEAKLLIDNFNCGNCCTLRADGRCFVVSWSGVPIFSVSAWKFI